MDDHTILKLPEMVAYSNVLILYVRPIVYGYAE